MKPVDVIVIGAGAAGLMCAIEAGKRARHVLVLDKTNKAGKKILMSGGGRCNFTNTTTTAHQYISNNPHFCKSALSRYSPGDFVALVEKHRIEYFEKKLGQLFCVGKSQQIVDMLLRECQEARVDLLLNQHITLVEKHDAYFVIDSNGQRYTCASLVIATGGLSIPTLGSSPFGYQIAHQFGLNVYPTRAGLVPLTWQHEDKIRFESLSGISIEGRVSCDGQSFDESILLTHRGLSGPAILQISSYWSLGDEIWIQWLPNVDWEKCLMNARHTQGDSHCKTILSQYLPKRLLDVFYDEAILSMPVKKITNQTLETIVEPLRAWRFKPNGTEGYRTAEVTLGGVDCHEISSKTFESKQVPGLYFIGEVLDVTGWLGGYNFQWAWSSGWAAGQVV